tara:strand:+ start:266 stop:1033 length:768 start_codon:yes stop_codon:yes gene_type:complete
MKLTITIIVIIVIFISLRSNKKEHFYNEPNPSPAPAPNPGPSPAPNPGPSPGPSPEPLPGPSPGPSPAPNPVPSPAPNPVPSPAPNPGPSPGPSPNPEPSYSVEVDNTNYGLNTPEVRQKIDKILDLELGLNTKPLFTEEGPKLIVKIGNVDYSSISDNKKLNIEKKIQQEIHSYLHKKYQVTKDKKFLVDSKRINIVAFTGSTYIVIQIMSKNHSGNLSNTEKDMLEFYNFMGVIKGGKLPIRENDYQQHHYSL